MAPSIYPDYPPDLTEKRYQNLLRETKDWSIAHGLAVRPPPSFVSTKQDPSGVLATTAPVTLFPSLFPRACFERATAVQQAYNELYSAIARDEEWLEGTVQEYDASPLSFSSVKWCIFEPQCLLRDFENALGTAA